MRIRTTQTSLSLADIQQIILSHAHDRDHKIRLKQYYRGQHDILAKVARNDDAPNNMIVANYCEYISNMSTGFFIGRPVAYSSISKKEEVVNELMEVFKYNDEHAHNLELAEEASITGEAYEFLYMDEEAKIRFHAIPSEEVVLVCEATLEENVLYAIRHYRVMNLDLATYQEFVEVYDKFTITRYSYNEGAFQMIGEPEPHYFGDVPVVEYANNRFHRGDFEGVLTLVDAYNKTQSFTLDDMEDFTDAFLVLKGMGGTNEEDVKELRKNKVISLDDGGSAEWLIKNLNADYIESVKKRLQTDIHKFSNIPDMSDEAFTGNTSGVAIKYKLIGLEQIRSRKEREFKRGLQRRIELIAGMLDTKSRVHIDFRDIEITFTPNIPANNEELANIVKTLYGLVSQKRLLSLLPFVTDPAEELEELQKEQAESIDTDEYPKLGAGGEVNAEDEKQEER